jgi:tRNA G10  N-methylase Trm11
MTILAAHNWRTNAHMIADVAKLGYITGLVLDPTYGEAGGFWKVWRPEQLVAHDIKLDGVDFLDLPYSSAKFDTIVFDPPYKLNGTPSQAGFDTRYGVDRYARWQDRIQLYRDGITALTPFAKPRGHLLVKCMDQVCSGQKRWVTDIVTNHAAELGYRKVDRFDFLRPPRPQRSQTHSHASYSTLLVFKKGT